MKLQSKMKLLLSVMKIHDILVRIRILGSVLMDPTPFFKDFNDAKKFNFFTFFSYNIIFRH
jgi:hypothetical protein